MHRRPSKAALIERSVLALRGQGHAKSCALSRRPGACAARRKSTNRYRRVLAICSLAGADVNAWMVRQGWALRTSAGHYNRSRRGARRQARYLAGTFTSPQQCDKAIGELVRNSSGRWLSLAIAAPIYDARVLDADGGRQIMSESSSPDWL